ncbi:MAG: glycoside hydrolase family 2 TIM barrel-domain containing protein [Bacteroidota bacterium]
MPYITGKYSFKIVVLCMAFPFFTGAQNKVINSGWQFSEDKTYWTTINVPHTWNTDDAFDDELGYRRGFGYYKKQVFVPSEERDKVHYLKFNAVNQEAMVFVNGKNVGNHQGGYTAFNFNVSQFLNYDAYNLIEVKVDNSHNVDIPPLDADFTFYGGIYRRVEWISKQKQHFSLADFASEGFYVNYYKVSEQSAGVEVKVLVDNFENVKARNQLHFKILDADGHLVMAEDKTLSLNKNSSDSLTIKFPEIKAPKLWSPDRPYLYKLEMALSDENGTILDSKVSNLGFRWASIDAEKGFFLNGKPIKLIGVNRHQDYEGYGNAVPLALQKEDIYLIKNMGANVIRFAHYPHARALYDLCDRLGVLVWTEIPVINLVTDSEAYFETSMNMQKAHIKQYYNHPSVVMFGYMNEIFIRLAFNRKLTDSEKENLKTKSLSLATQLENLTRELAPNHITVMACHLNEVYNETGIADLPMLLGWNLYFGWYDAQIENLGPFLDEQHRRFPNRAMFLSEYGPGADIRNFTKHPKKFDFTTDYQAKLHQSYYQQIMERPFMAGMTAWNFADFGSEFRGDAIPHVNQKGLVQYDRTPKGIYYWYKAILNDAVPFVHLATETLKGLTLFNEETYPIQVFSNQGKASVILNGETFKTVQFKNGLAVIDVPFKNGTNTIKLITDKASEEKSVEVLRIEQLDFKSFDRFGINIGSHFYFNDTERSITFVPDQAYKKGWFGFLDGEAFGMTKDKNQGIPHNIKNSDSEPLFQTMLEGCTHYKVDIPKGRYKVDLFFVEPQIKPTENIYNLTESKENQPKRQRIFDVYLNDILIEKQLNLAKNYPEKYAVTLASELTVNDQDGLNILLKPVKGQLVISGILIHKID